MKHRKKETKKQKISLVNDTQLPNQQKNKIRVLGLGNIETPKYRYSDVCPNSME